MSVITANQPLTHGHRLLPMSLIPFISSSFIPFHFHYSHRNCQSSLHPRITRMAFPVVPVLDGASADGQPRLLHRDG
ncbi:MULTISPECIES: hypothetical protein [Bacteroides]|nr:MULTISPECIES: hypothetical protein [Bacteroides]MCS2765080.1 hypothetical protein [Bacteroides thetaiotaomicron]MDC2220141.1 hypothetical protein [Bacteroides thetaiotaomicron]MDC2225658.1 hypothetical protein [Bacteroides thetaiotaomicron]